tara:strand:- start:1593 stop:2921 length:1329 start_codon:yes stop_codon:yes gene_type:complete
MKVKHYNNSFIEVEANGKKLICDPWIGNTNEGAWYSYPMMKSPSYLNKLNPDFIYISHLHCDHFDPKTLNAFKKKNTPIIIKNFEQKRLKNKIHKLGFKNIIEIDELIKKKLSAEFNVMIVPQMSSNTDGLEDKINYDLDTSIVIQSGINKKILYNNVDNPLSIKELKNINSLVLKKFKHRVNYMCFQIGAASGYPQSFLNIDRETEKNKILEKNMKKIKTLYGIFKPDIFFPAGGTYMISGKFHKLNRYISQPSIKDLTTFSLTSNVNLQYIEGGNHLITEETPRVNRTFNINSITKQKALRRLSKIKYFYEKKCYDVSLNLLNELFVKSLNNYHSILKIKKINADWNIKLCVYDDLKLSNDYKISKKNSGFIRDYIIKGNLKSMRNSIDLTCHLDKKLLYCLLKRISPWNTALTGSIIIFSRKSKKYNVTLENSLNFLAA